MASIWDQQIEHFARDEDLSEEQQALLKRFLEHSMPRETIQVSLGSASFSDRTTQAFTAADDSLDEDELFELPASPTDRYLDVGRLGIGGMGEVRRVRDGLLNRFVAMKIIRDDLAHKRAAVIRFIAEAQATAQLQHPGAVPVHDLGQLADGRWYFTMKELRGQTLEAVFAEHRLGRFPRGLRGLVEILGRVADAVAYAHENGAVHRDLKPANVLVGSFREVIVLDWGLVKASGSPESAGIVTDLGGLHTRLGSVIGTPSYMPPEQAEGRHDTLGPTADVYALGAMLYEMLCGRRPYEGEPTEVIANLKQGPPPPLPHTAPAGLVQICERAMHRLPAGRFAEAGAFSSAIQDWLDGTARRARALELLDRADALKPVVESALQDAERLQLKAEQVAETVPSWAPVEQKVEAWELEDQAQAKRIEAELAGVERLQLLRGALNELPGMPEAESRLAYVYHFCHARAERLGDRREAAQYEMLLRAHDTGEFASYLAGDGKLSLRTRPQGAGVKLCRVEDRERLATLVHVGALPDTPFDRQALRAGSYLLELDHPDRALVRYPVFIGRSGHWHGREPGGRAPAAVYLPGPDELEEDSCYVPASWALLGPLPADEVWVEGFVVQRFPVSVGDYLTFLNSLLDQDREQEAELHQPRIGRDLMLPREEGRFVAPQGVPGWSPDCCVTSVSQLSARVYARWYAARTGKPWRLPWESEWEKAARGVDGRRFVMGDYIDPAWAEVRDSSPDESPKPIGTYAEDTSIYGVRDLSGGAGEWCRDRYDQARMKVRDGIPVLTEAHEDDRAVMRGGFRTAPRDICLTWFRHAVPAKKTSIRVGFRLVRTIEARVELEPRGAFDLKALASSADDGDG